MGGAGLFVIAASIFGAHVWPVLELRHTRWRIDTDGLEIRRGVVWRHTISVPRERIQHTDVAQGPIQRRFGLATLRAPASELSVAHRRDLCRAQRRRCRGREAPPGDSGAIRDSISAREETP